MQKFKETTVPSFLKENPHSRNFKAYYRAIGGGRHLVALVCEDETPRWGWLKHASISAPDRNPTWEEIHEAKDYFFGDIDCMMVLPKNEDYVNVHQYTFHIWQTPERWGLR